MFKVKLIFWVFLFPINVIAQTFPTTQQLDSDLATSFATSQAQPVIRFRTEISRRVEKLLIQQARYLVSTLHPWSYDDRALLLTDGGSLEAQIRPNAHTAYGLAVLYRAAPDNAFTPDFTREMARDNALAILRFPPPHPRRGRGEMQGWKTLAQSVAIRSVGVLRGTSMLAHVG